GGGGGAGGGGGGWGRAGGIQRHRQLLESFAHALVGARRLRGAADAIGREPIGERGMAIRGSHQPWQQTGKEDERALRWGRTAKSELSASARVCSLAVEAEALRGEAGLLRCGEDGARPVEERRQIGGWSEIDLHHTGVGSDGQAGP